MNYKTYALVSISIISLVLVLAGLNAKQTGAAFAQPSVMPSKTIDKTESVNIYGQVGGTSGKYKAVSSSVGENKVGNIFHFISTTPTNTGNNTYGISVASKTFPIIYHIAGNGNKLKNISVAKDNTTLVVNIASQSNGNLTIQLPRNLIDSKKQGNQDSSYAIFQDSQPWQKVQEIKSNAQVRTLAIDFEKGTGVIEIAGSVILPANTFLSPAATNANKPNLTISQNTAAPTQSATNASSNSTINLKFAGNTFPIIYHIAGNGNKLKNISVAKDNTTLIADIASQSNGNLTIQLPRNLIDSKKQGNQDSSYAIFQDSQPWQKVQEIKSNAQVRTLAIDFEKGTGVIEIAGSKVLPEFGGISAVVLAVAIIGIIAASTKNKQFRLRFFSNH